MSKPCLGLSWRPPMALVCPLGVNGQRASAWLRTLSQARGTALNACLGGGGKAGGGDGRSQGRGHREMGVGVGPGMAVCGQKCIWLG